MEGETQDLLKTPKESKDIHDYAFLVESNDNSALLKPSIHRHELLGFPVVPFLGKYAGASYEFGKVLSLVSADVNFKEQEQQQFGWVLANNKKQQVNIPEEVADLLLNIPVHIEKSKKKVSEPQAGEGKGSKKEDLDEKSNENKTKFADSCEIKEDLVNDKEEEKTLETDVPQDSSKGSKPRMTKSVPQKGNFSVTNRVKFSWTIQLNNIHLSKQFQKDPLLVLNYVMHPVLFPNISFEKVKKLTKRTPISLVVPKELGSHAGISEYLDPNKGQNFTGLKIGNLRAEYSSVHLSGESLCFSPNNMKLVINREVPIGIFWTVALDETNHCNTCYLHWIINESTLFQPLENICKEAKNLEELFTRLEEQLGKDNEVLQYTKKLYSI